MATQPSANPKICSHSFSECSLNPVYLNCTVYAKRVFCLACLGVSGCCAGRLAALIAALVNRRVASSNLARGAKSYYLV
jgi:hypothetical protein